MSKEIVVCTGGLGYIGSHTVISVFEAGFEPIILDNLSNSNIKCLERLNKLLKCELMFIKADIREPKEINEAFKKIEEKYKKTIFGVIHFAGLKAVGQSQSFPLEYYENNVTGTINLLKQMKEFKIKNIIFSSSACVYGNKSNCTENDPIRPNNVYGRTKAIIENILEDVSKKDIKAISLRYFNPIGAHPSGEIGESPLDIHNNLMPIILQVVTKRREKLQIFGNDYATKDGSGVRDYLHVVDIADAHTLALKNLEKMKDYEVINLGTGTGVSVLELVQTFENVNSLKINYEIAPRRPGDVDIVTANCEKAFKLLGWKPSKSLEDCCKDSMNWISKNPKGYE